MQNIIIPTWSACPLQGGLRNKQGQDYQIRHSIVKYRYPFKKLFPPLSPHLLAFTTLYITNDCQASSGMGNISTKPPGGIVFGFHATETIFIDTKPLFMKINFLKAGALILGLAAFSTAGAQVSSTITSTTNAAVNTAGAVNGTKSAVQQTTSATKAATQTAVDKVADVKTAATATTTNAADAATATKVNTDVKVDGDVKTSENNVQTAAGAKVQVKADEKATSTTVATAQQAKTAAKQEAKAFKQEVKQDAKQVKQTAAEVKPAATKAEVKTSTQAAVKTGNK